MATANYVIKKVRAHGEWVGKINNIELGIVTAYGFYAMAKEGRFYLVVDDPSKF